MKNLFIGNTTKLKLKNVIDILESELSLKEKHRIKDSNTYVTLNASPFSHLELSENPFKNLEYLNIISIDIEFVDENRIKDKELASIILHEIGHFLNKPNAKNQIELTLKGISDPREQNEFCADDYCRLCGFGEYLLKNLTDSIISNPQKFDKEITKKRINRIQNNKKIINYLL